MADVKVPKRLILFALAVLCALLACCAVSRGGVQRLPAESGSPLVAGAPRSPLMILEQPASAGVIYSPLLLAKVRRFFPVVEQPGPCGTNAEAARLADLFVGDALQQRDNPVCNASLVNAAQFRANDMVTKGYFAHMDQQGFYANHWALQYGCHIPDWYPANGNNIESIALNYPTVSTTWTAWLSSPLHRTHVLGEDPFFRGQIHYGFGVAQTPWGKVYVILTSQTC